MRYLSVDNIFVFFLDVVGTGRFARCCNCRQYNCTTGWQILNLQGPFQIVGRHNTRPIDRASCVHRYRVFDSRRNDIDGSAMFSVWIVCVCRVMGLALFQHRVVVLEKKIEQSSLLCDRHCIVCAIIFRIPRQGVCTPNMDLTKPTHRGNIFIRNRLFSM